MFLVYFALSQTILTKCNWFCDLPYLKAFLFSYLKSPSRDTNKLKRVVLAKNFVIAKNIHLQLLISRSKCAYCGLNAFLNQNRRKRGAIFNTC